jgi:flagellar biogenesis protein FliO
MLRVFLISIFSFFNLFADQMENIETQIVQVDNNLTSLPEVEFKSVFFKMLFTLIALVILIVVSFYFFKRFSKMKFSSQNQNSNIKIIEKRVLSPKSILYLIEADGKKSLISESHLEVRKIKDLDQ